MSGDSFLDYVLEQLAEARGLKTRAMFGGHGIYMGDAFFGIVHSEATLNMNMPKACLEWPSGQAGQPAPSCPRSRMRSGEAGVLASQRDRHA